VIKMTTKTKEIVPPMLSSYGENLDGKVECRYLHKLFEIGIDALLIPAKQLREECLPPVQSMVLLSYLVGPI